MKTNYDDLIIFLDIDGVLTSSRMHVAHSDRGAWSRLDPSACAFIERQCVRHGALVVISSTWRRGREARDFRDIFGAAGFSKIALHRDWRTPFIPSENRGMEIKRWLDDHLYKRYIILDDDKDMLPEQADRFVLTDSHNGMMFKHYRLFEEIRNKSELPLLAENGVDYL